MFAIFDIRLPEGLSTGIMFDLAGGKGIDRAYGESEGVFRKKWWFIKENDTSYKNRILIKMLADMGYRREKGKWVKETNGC